MARKSLKPHLNQIRAWVQQGRTEAWIAHQLEVSTSQLREFRSRFGLDAAGESLSEELDLRDEIEAEIEAAVELEAVAPPEEIEEGEGGDEEPEVEERGTEEMEDEEPEVEERGTEEPRRRRPERSEGERPRREPRSRQQRDRPAGERGGDDRPRRRRRRRRRKPPIEAVFDHGAREGYGIWLDPAIQDNPVYAEHWAGHDAVQVSIDAERIVIQRASKPAG